MNIAEDLSNFADRLAQIAREGRNAAEMIKAADAEFRTLLERATAAIASTPELSKFLSALEQQVVRLRAEVGGAAAADGMLDVLQAHVSTMRAAIDESRPPTSRMLH